MFIERSHVIELFYCYISDTYKLTLVAYNICIWNRAGDVKAMCFGVIQLLGVLVYNVTL